MSALDTLDKNMPILIVDDFNTMRRVVRNCLRSLGFNNVTEAEDGLAAWEKLQSEEFKLIISDWNMPNMMGMELLMNVREDGKHKDIPFLMVTAEAQKENVQEAIKAGLSNFIVKPFTANALQTKMEAIFTK